MIVDTFKYTRIFSQRPANIRGTDPVLLEPGLDIEFHVRELYSGLDELSELEE
jgi:hypothetical protein